jgi:FG-GAP repeat
MRIFMASKARRSVPLTLAPALVLALSALGALGPTLLLPPAAAAASLTPPGPELTPVQPASPFGTVLAISGDTAAVTGFVADRAVVFIFVRSAGTWSQQARIVDPALPDPSSVFGSALALSGDTLAIGAGAEASPSSSVYIYVRAAGTWSLQAHLQPARAARLGFGTALTLAGDALAVGAPGAVAGTTAGAVHVYARTGGTWSRQAILAAATPAPADRFGRAVGVAHQHLVVGGSGFAEVFDLLNGTWKRAAVFHGSGMDTGFGSSAAASIETVAVGDPSSQQVSLFIHTSAGWFHQADVTPPDAQAGEFGSAISLSQDLLEVGAPGSSRRRVQASGAAYVFVRQQRRWLLEGAFGLAAPAAGERFGGAVAASIDTALVGSTGGASAVPTAAWLLDGLDNP